MKKLFVPALVALAMLPETAAHAGTKVDYFLELSAGGLTASGALGSVRKGGGANDTLACLVLTGQFVPSDLYVECDAANDSASISCISNSPTLVSVAQTIQADSHIAFSGTSCGPGCCTLTSLIVSNGSFLYPTQQ